MVKCKTPANIRWRSSYRSPYCFASIMAIDRRANERDLIDGDKQPIMLPDALANCALISQIKL